MTDSVLDAVLAAAADGPDLSVTADLTVRRAGVEMTVTAYTDLVRVEFESLRDAARLARAERGSRGGLVAGLVASGLTVAVHVGRARIALLGTDAAPGPLSRRLVGERTQVYPGGVVRAALPG